MNFKGQGALEYILLIAGAILVAAIVMGILFILTQESETSVEAGAEGGDIFIDNTIGDIRKGLGGPLCGNGNYDVDTLEECDYDSADPPNYFFPVDKDTCNEVNDVFTGGTLECGTLCKIITDNCTTS